MDMDQFDIIGALETYALAQGWKFVYGVNEFERSLGAIQEYDPGELLFMVDAAAQPTIRGGRIQDITYTCLLMLGRKFDADGQSANLDETNKQKYDRRLKELYQLLAAAIGQIACDNELDVSVGQMVVEVNLVSENIDFCTAQNVIYLQ